MQPKQDTTNGPRFLESRRGAGSVILRTCLAALFGLVLTATGLWLGHVSVETTNRYAGVNLETCCGCQSAAPR